MTGAKSKKKTVEIALHEYILFKRRQKLADRIGKYENFDLRRKGLTIPTADIIIASLAMDNDSVVLHLDRHFSLMKKYYTSLSLQSIKSESRLFVVILQVS